MPSKKLTLPNQGIDNLIREVRGQKVILDSDLARVYGVATKRLNEQFRRNRSRFPEDFAFQTNLRSQIAASKKGDQSDTSNWSQFATSSSKHRGKVYRPWAFTEHGALQAANILNCARAVQMSVFVIRAFVKMRDELAAKSTMVKRLAQIDNTLFLHDSALRDLYQKLRPLLAPSSEPPPKPRIGFHPQNIKRG
ncbi:MAG TPA: ORF6N domain-containing protein [Chthoniobacterales bacterium]|nr:ORF6N domain-containing protein [Chthoniobacterales bacterium]